MVRINQGWHALGEPDEASFLKRRQQAPMRALSFSKFRLTHHFALPWRALTAFSAPKPKDRHEFPPTSKKLPLEEITFRPATDAS
jgi:hypothetical protein